MLDRAKPYGGSIFEGKPVLPPVEKKPPSEAEQRARKFDAMIRQFGERKYFQSAK